MALSLSDLTTWSNGHTKPVVWRVSPSPSSRQRAGASESRVRSGRAGRAPRRRCCSVCHPHGLGNHKVVDVERRASHSRSRKVRAPTKVWPRQIRYTIFRFGAPNGGARLRLWLACDRLHAGLCEQREATHASSSIACSAGARRAMLSAGTGGSSTGAAVFSLSASAMAVPAASPMSGSFALTPNRSEPGLRQ